MTERQANLYEGLQRGQKKGGTHGGSSGGDLCSVFDDGVDVWVGIGDDHGLCADSPAYVYQHRALWEILP